MKNLVIIGLLFFLAGVWLFQARGQDPLVLGEIIIDDYSGNRDGWLDPGETAEMEIPVIHTGSFPLFAVKLSLNSADPGISIFLETLDYGYIEPGDTVTRAFYVTASYSIPQNSTVLFNIVITAPPAITITDEIIMEVGKKDVLIADFEDNDITSDFLEDRLDYYGYEFERLSYLPETLKRYRSVFVCLGVRNAGRPITQEEGDALAAYLDRSGRLYLEGGDAWFYDPPTAVRPYFNILGTADGDNSLDRPHGIDGTITENMIFDYEGERVSNDRIMAMGAAELIFENVNPAYGIAVAYDGGYYRTVGSSFEFGGLTDYVFPSTKDELLQRYLEFFQVKKLSVEARFMAEQPFICLGESVQFENYSIGNGLTFQWIFEGGTPATSTEAEPLVFYNTPGNYLVSLLVEQGQESHFLIRDEYIRVGKIPTAELIAGPMVCAGDTSFVTIALSGSPPMSFELFDGTDTIVYTNLYVTSIQHPVILNENTTVWVTSVIGHPNCQGVGDSLVMEVFPQPSATLNAPPEICMGDTALIMISFAGTPPFSFEMSTGESIVTGDSAYLLKKALQANTSIGIISLSDASGCLPELPLPVNIIVNNVPVIALPNDTIICAGTALFLDASVPGAVSWLWKPGMQTTPYITIDSAGTGMGSITHSVIVTAQNGCTAEDSVTVGFKDCTGIPESLGISDLCIYPNPAGELFTIEFMSQYPQDVLLRLTSIGGQLIFQEQLFTVKGEFRKQMPTIGFPSGVYLLEVYGENGGWNTKVVFD
ncbi:MAG: PKD domain-containing protein [Bacteroidetes bacterium]|nr:PKD domain-containing protein [Bacteroidota bacterium]